MITRSVPKLAQPEVLMVTTSETLSMPRAQRHLAEVLCRSDSALARAYPPVPQAFALQVAGELLTIGVSYLQLEDDFVQAFRLSRTQERRTIDIDELESLLRDCLRDRPWSVWRVRKPL